MATMVENEKSSGRQPDKPHPEIDEGFGSTAARFDKVEADMREGFTRVDQAITGLRVEMTGLRGEMKTQGDTLRGEINGLRTELKEEIGGVRTELKEEIGGVRTELKEEIGGVRTELKEEISGLRTELKKEIGGVKGEVNGLRSEMNTRFLALEGAFASLQHTLIVSAVAIIVALVGLPTLARIF
jgi:SMC interacting uncharacterized protein involved in chromosome segregation